MGNPNQYPGPAQQSEIRNNTRPSVKPEWKPQPQPDPRVVQALGNLAIKNK